LFKETLFVKLIISVLVAALIASSRVSKNWFPICALDVSLALTFIGNNNVKSTKTFKNIRLISIPPFILINNIQI